MARAHRVALITTALISIYLLAFFSVFPVPFVDENIAQKILPVVSSFVVRACFRSCPPSKIPLGLISISRIDSMVALGLVWVIHTLVSGLGSAHF